MTVAIPSARNMARGSCRRGCDKSLAVKVMTPKPRKAKKVSATLEMMSLADGYPDGASRWGWRLARVDTAKTVRLPMTTTTTTVCALATALDPRTLSIVMTQMSRTANTLTQVVFESVSAELA